MNIFNYLSWNFVFLVGVGSFAGLVVGALPGLSVTMATALLVSITFTWNVGDALALMMGVYVVGVYAGAISAILINIPGTPASIATTIDGYPMTRKGQAYKALWTAAVYSFIGTIFGLVVLAVSAKPITTLALAFSPIDYFLLAVFGLSTVGSLTSKSFLKGLISAAIGVFLSLVGMDPILGAPRFTYGSMELQAGISLIPVLIGLFGFSEVLAQVGEGASVRIAEKIGKEKIPLRFFLKMLPLSLRACVIGTFIGALPGTGGPVAALLAYDHAKKTVKNPSAPFGEGAVEGIVAAESSNNACIGGALIPMLTLAVPGDAVTAVMLSALYIHGLRPGPLLFTQSPALFDQILLGGFLGSIMILVLGFTIGPLLAKLILIPKKILIPIITILCVIGTYAVNGSVVEVFLMILFGFVGYIMKKRGYSTAPMVLGLVLGQMMDANFRRAVSLAQAADNPWTSLLTGPISVVLLLVTIGSILMNIPALRNLFSIRKKETKTSLP